MLKSALFASVSVQPLPLRVVELVLSEAPPAAVPSEQFADPQPTKSLIAPPVGQEPESAVVLETSATLPLLADMLMLPVASGVGRLVVPDPPAAPWTR